MKFKIEDREYEWSPKITISEAFLLKEKAYLTIPQLGPAIAQVDPYAIAFLVYIAKRRNGEVVKWEDVGELDLMSFDIVEEEAAAEEEPGKSKSPTPIKSAGKSGGRTRKPATSDI